MNYTLAPSALCLQHTHFLLYSSNQVIVAMIQCGDTSKVTSDQLKALQKLLPDSDTVRALAMAAAMVILYALLSNTDRDVESV